MEAMTKDLWVFIETKSDGSAKNVGLELLNPGRRLADKQGGALVAVVIGNHVDEAVKACAAHDADKVLVVEGPEYENYTTDAYVNAMYHLVTKFGPTTLMIGATPNGRDFGPRLSCRLKTGLTADCTSLDIDEQSGDIAWTRPAFGGNLMATILCSDTRPQIGTVRPGVFKKAAEVAPHAEIIKEDYHVAPEDIRTKLLRVIHDAAEEIDKEERFPEETVRQMAEKGMLGIPFPEEYGGTGMDNLSYAQCVEELSKVCAATGVIVSVHTSLGSYPIYLFGTEEQKQKYLVPLASGEKLGAFGLTEPGAGTDASGQKTTAVLDGDHYVLNGSKIFITNAGPADTYVLMAMTDKEKGNHGISAFIVEKGFPGFSIGKHEEKMGIRASSTCELIFEDCIVPKENLLGEEGKGFKYAMMTLDGGRIGIAAQALGIAQGAIDETVEYVKTRRQFGHTLSFFQNTQFELAQMQANTDAARLLVYRAACAKDNHEPYSHLAAMAKLNAAQNASDVTRRCLQLFGGYGYTRD